MPLSGSLVRTKRRLDPNQAPLHQADPSHGIPGQTDANPTWQAPPYQEAAPARLGFEWIARGSGPAAALPEAPWEDGHDYDPGHGVSDDPTMGRSPGVRAQHSDEEYKTDAFNGLGPEAAHIDEQTLRRGLNSEPQNNPADPSYGGEGFRRGHYRQWNLWRKMAPPFRTHDQRAAALNIVTAIGDAPTPRPASPYNSPFSSLARVRRTVNARPQMRRIPERFDEAVITDGSEIPQPPGMVAGEWVAR